MHLTTSADLWITVYDFAVYSSLYTDKNKHLHYRMLHTPSTVQYNMLGSKGHRLQYTNYW